MTVLQLQPEQQRRLFLVASGVSTAGSFAGITAKGWILMDGSADPFLLALNFAALALPTLIISGPAGVRTDRVGCERVLVQSQWALLAAAGLGALAIPLFEGMAQVVLLLSSTLLVGIAGAYELTARINTVQSSWVPINWGATSQASPWCSTLGNLSGHRSAVGC